MNLTKDSLNPGRSDKESRVVGLPDRISPLGRRRSGVTLIEVMVAITMVTVSLMSIATAAFDLLRSGKGTQEDTVANAIVAERVIDVRQEFDSAASYLAAYGAPGTVFDPTTVSPAADETLSVPGISDTGHNAHWTTAPAETRGR